MRAAIITIAGVSSRFNEGIEEADKKHKIIYFEKNSEDTLLYHLLEKMIYADKIILVGGNKFEDVKKYCEQLPSELKDKIVLVYNDHYADLTSGYSLYVGLKEMFERFDSIDDVIFAEGDLDLDKESFERIIRSDKNVLTYSNEAIYANKAVVLYMNGDNQYKYAFNSSHGLLSIEEPFSLILNSGQVWKFNDMEKLKTANDKFSEGDISDSNLGIIRNYVSECNSDEFELIGFERWTNCNTRSDYKKILSFWEEDTK